MKSIAAAACVLVSAGSLAVADGTTDKQKDPASLASPFQPQPTPPARMSPFHTPNVVTQDLSRQRVGTVVVFSLRAAVGVAKEKADKRTVDYIVKEICPWTTDGELSGSDRGRRREEELARMGEKGRRALLAIVASNDYDIEARWCAAEHLQRKNERRALPLFRAIAADTREPLKLRRKSIWCLSGMDDPEAADVILGVIREGRDDQVFSEAINAITAYDSPRVRTAMRELLVNGNYPSRVSGSILYAIGVLRDVEAIPILREMARRNADGLDRLWIADALARIGIPEGVRATDSRRAAKEVCASIENLGTRIDCASRVIRILEEYREMPLLDNPFVDPAAIRAQENAARAEIVRELKALIEESKRQ